MLSKRIIACLDVCDGRVVKGVQFEALRAAGDPAELARRYNEEGIDELVILDITATLERRPALAESIPVIASGGAGALDHFAEVFTAGRADAALAASIFHYSETSVRALKEHLRERGIPVRLC